MICSRKGKITKPALGLSSFVTIAVTAAVAVPAHAQSVDKIIVTAQKREESIQDVPISLQAVTGEFLEDSQFQDLRDLQTFVPSLRINTTANPRNATISLRGVGTSGVNAGIEQSVAVYIDDVYYVRPASAIQDLVDIASIEVLRGPQGTLYGRNNSVGSIKIQTRAPSENFEAQGSALFGSFNRYRFTGFVSGGLTDTLSARLSVFGRDQDGFDENTRLSNLFRTDQTLNDESAYGLRGQLRWAPSEATDLRVILDYTHKKTTCCTADFSIVTPGLIAYSDRVVAGTGDPSKAFTNFTNFDNELQSFVPPFSEEDNFGASATLNHDFSGGWLDGATLTSVSAYRSAEITADQIPPSLPMDLLYSQDNEKTVTASQELRVASAADRTLEWITGIYLYYQKSEFDTLTYFGPDFQFSNLAMALGFDPILNSGPAQGASLDGEIETKSYAVFAQGTLNLTDEFSLTAGARLTTDDKEARLLAGNDNTSPAVIAALPASLFTGDRTDTEVTWQFTAQYSLTPDHLLYATASRGFKSGGFNARRLRTGTQFEFESEFVTNYEGGIKTAWFDSRLIANLTYFYMPVTGFQSSQLNPSGTGVIVNNVGDLVQQGVEADFQAQPFEALSLTASVAYLDSEYTDFTEAPCALDGGGPPSPTLAGACDLTGFRVNDTPKWTVSSTATYADTIPSTEIGWFARAEFLYVGEHFQDQDLATQSLQKAYDVWNFRVGLEGEEDRWSVVGFIENAFDEGYALATLQAVFGGPLGASGSYVTYNGPPRRYGIEGTVRF